MFSDYEDLEIAIPRRPLLETLASSQAAAVRTSKFASLLGLRTCVRSSIRIVLSYMYARNHGPIVMKADRG